MDETKLNSIEKERFVIEHKGFFSRLSKKFLATLAFLVVLAILVYLGFWGKGVINKMFSKPEVYSAVFLVNGQVYFGKITKNNSQEMILSNVFYLQSSGDSTVTNANAANSANNALNQTHFNLVKLGNELHGPTDELFINKSQITFYEKLRANSKVVESIKNYK